MDEWTANHINEITAPILEHIGEQEVITETLAIIVNDWNSLYSSFQEQVQLVDTLTNENASLKEANMKLYLQIAGNVKKDDEDSNNNSNNDDKPSFEDLFDEKGGLK